MAGQSAISGHSAAFLQTLLARRSCWAVACKQVLISPVISAEPIAEARLRGHLPLCLRPDPSPVKGRWHHQKGNAMASQSAHAHRWDPVVRLTHWSIALAVLANALITEEGTVPHIWVGCALAGILALRMLWGFIGPAEARFRAFWPSPRKAMAHLREIRSNTVTRHVSHNPLGALMVYAIWACLLMIIATGIAMAGPPPWDSVDGAEEQRAASAASGGEDHGDEDGEEQEEEGLLGEVHETAVNLLYFLILLHLAGVVFETRRSGKQVLVAMAPL